VPLTDEEVAAASLAAASSAGKEQAVKH
jgi:hypothetical protein